MDGGGGGGGGAATEASSLLSSWRTVGQGELKACIDGTQVRESWRTKYEHRYYSIYDMS